MGHVIKSAGGEYFDTVERAVGLTELVELFKFPQSSAAAILKSLVVLGYLYHDRATQTYLPTARLAHLGTWASTLLIDRDVIQLVTHLSRAVEETVVLGVQNDLMAQYIYVQLAARSVVAISLQIRAAVSERNAASEQASCRQSS